MTNNTQYTRVLVKYLLPLYILALIILTLFRGIFIYIFYDDFLLLYKTSEELHPILMKAVTKGFRYDNIVVAYTMIIPLLGLIAARIFSFSIKKYIIASRIYFILIFALLFAISCIDFPYFKYFWTHPTITILDWVGFGGTFGMLLQETSYYVYYLLYFVALGLIIAASIYLGRYVTHTKGRFLLWDNEIFEIILFSIAAVLTFFGTRGHLSVSPIGLNAAYFTDNKLVSDLCVSPTYHFMANLDSHNVDYDELMDPQVAIANVQKGLGIVADSTKYKNPLSRQIVADSIRASHNYNIVLVFMESMSVALMNQEVDGKKLTPYLDSLAKTSYYFENIYSSGVHTNVGVASTLISYPSRFSTHMMGRYPFEYKGISTTLRSKAYSSSFFIPNEEVYDNMGIFLKKNGIDTLFSDNHYPKEAKANNFGIPDDYLFNFALKEINKSKEPFFSSILTVSNHPPYVVSEVYKGRGANDEQSILAYVDNSIKEFMEKASKEDWYENTIFIFQGDHGKLIGEQNYNMSLNYNHIPLIIYSPAFEDMPKQFSQYGGQVDIFPTVMGLLNQPYVNSTLGVDLLKEERPYMFFSSDTQLGCKNDEFFYVFNPKDGDEYLYDLKSTSAANVIEANREMANMMKEYALSMIVSTNYLEENGLVEEY